MPVEIYRSVLVAQGPLLSTYEKDLQNLRPNEIQPLKTRIPNVMPLGAPRIALLFLPSPPGIELLGGDTKHLLQISQDTKFGEGSPGLSNVNVLNFPSKFAQRLRVRKLQYISALERSIQALAAEGCEVSAECGFLNQQIIVLGMENKALQQRFAGLSQEQRIKHC